jgi:hypothetical protein
VSISHELRENNEETTYFAKEATAGIAWTRNSWLPALGKRGQTPTTTTAPVSVPVFAPVPLKAWQPNRLTLILPTEQVVTISANRLI